MKSALKEFLKDKEGFHDTEKTEDEAFDSIIYTLLTYYGSRSISVIVLSNAQKIFLAEISMEDLYTVALALIETEFAHYITSMSSYVGKDLTIIPVTKLVGRRNSQTHKKYYSFLDWFTSLLAYKAELINFQVLSKYDIKRQLSWGCFTNTTWDVTSSQARHMMTQN